MTFICAGENRRCYATRLTAAMNGFRWVLTVLLPTRPEFWVPFHFPTNKILRKNMVLSRVRVFFSVV